MSSNQPSKTSGQYHSAKGTATETLGSTTGSESWQQAGAEEHAQGEREYNAAQAQGYAEGTKDRMGGRKDAVFGAVTGDREQEASGNVRRDKGETQQAMNRPS
ncbi:hypothetical protein GSI_11849 [Ganoderma sinense ZZ0214-1]|uniref:CsbD-like domain-containing protein n=1 Tax=Ganoderma sinense ZZ0214-1 TaxID=1077348 RepID=A0A2G8RX51_9APHY|nr:hypothetical protein GSI_11849 [Ganoderma sinense ZZ0214-1]